MKEKIYTIPINEAFDQDCECPLCLIERRLEKEAIEYELGAAMMEPDHRELSNEKGFCKRHLEMMFEKDNKLSLALVLDTHLLEVRKKISALKDAKKGLFKKETPTIKETVCSCIVCEKIENTMNRYVDVLVSMWKDEPEFREKFQKSRGFCLSHFDKLLELAKGDFLKALIEKEEKELEAINEDIHRFTLKFDYRNRDMEWGTAKDAPKRSVEKLVGYIKEE